MHHPTLIFSSFPLLWFSWLLRRPIGQEAPIKVLNWLFLCVRPFWYAQVNNALTFVAITTPVRASLLWTDHLLLFFCLCIAFFVCIDIAVFLFTFSFPSVSNILVVRIGLLLGGDLLCIQMPCNVCCYVLSTLNSHLRRIRRPAHKYLLSFLFFVVLQSLASTKMRENLTSSNPNQTTNQHCHHASNQRANAKLSIEFYVAPFPVCFLLTPFFFRNGIFSPCFAFGCMG